MSETQPPIEVLDIHLLLLDATVDRLEEKLDRLYAAFETLLDELTGYPDVPSTVEIAAGAARDKLDGKS